MERLESSSEKLTRRLDEHDLKIDYTITTAKRADGTTLQVDQAIDGGTLVGFTKKCGSITAVIYAEDKPFILLEDCNY